MLMHVVSLVLVLTEKQRSHYIITNIKGLKYMEEKISRHSINNQDGRVV